MKPFLRLASLVSLSLGLATGCGSERTAQKPPRPVKTQVVEANAAAPRLRYSANIEPREQVSLAFKVSGYVTEVRQVRGVDGKLRNLQEGDVAGRGTVLARVREDDYRESVNRARGNVEQAAAGLQKASLDYERAQRLYASDSLTKPDFDSATAAHDAALAQSKSARASLAEAELHLRDTALTAPMNGLILARNIEVGTLVGPGSVGFLIADTSSVKAVFGVPDTLMRRARMGVVLPVTTEAYGEQQFPGRITAISPAADKSSRVFQIELTIANPKGLLKPGMIATVEVPEEDAAAARAAASVLLVPLAAIVKPSEGGQFAVYVVETEGTGTVARLRPIEVGEVYGNMVSVRKGVERGARVVTSGASLLTDRDPVQVIP